MCHPLLLTHVEVDLRLDPDLSAIEITATVRTTGKTGVEMEALTAVTGSASPSTICARPSTKPCASKSPPCPQDRR